MIHVKLPDGTVKEYAEESSALDVAESIGSRLAQAVAAAEVDGKIVDATRPLKEVSQNGDEINLKLLTTRDAEALAVMRHSCAHVMARAVMRVYPNVGLAFGPTLANGFYYDFDMEQKISEDDFPKIEAEMKNIIKEAESFERFSLRRDEAVDLCKELNQELKVEHIQTGLGEHDSVSFYRQGEFVDLCRGPHIPNAGIIKAFKLLSVAGSYWKGDANNKSLQRLYGTAWFSKDDLKNYLEQVEEAKRRDHRVLGRKLGLFQINPDVGQGLCLWLPKGRPFVRCWKSSSRKNWLSVDINLSIRHTSGGWNSMRPRVTSPTIAIRNSPRSSGMMQARWSMPGSVSCKRVI
ncbi:MAG: TGS domain-containing protein [Planctomycetaceae bacterium]